MGCSCHISELLCLQLICMLLYCLPSQGEGQIAEGKQDLEAAGSGILGSACTLLLTCCCQSKGAHALGSRGSAPTYTSISSRVIRYLVQRDSSQNRPLTLTDLGLIFSNAARTAVTT